MQFFHPFGCQKIINSITVPLILSVLSCLKWVNTIIVRNTKHSKLLKKIKVNIFFESSDITVYDNLHY